MKKFLIVLIFKDGFLVEDGVGYEYYVVFGYSSWGGVVDVVYFKDDFVVWSYGDTVFVS